MANINLKLRFQDPEWRINALLAGLIFVMPLGITFVTNLFLFSILMHSIISNSGKDWVSALKNPVYLVSALFYLYYAFTIVWAENTTEGWAQLETKLSFLVSPLVVATNVNVLNRTHLKSLKWGLVLGSLLTMVIAFTYAFYQVLSTGQTGYVTDTGFQVSYFTYTELSSPFMHVAYLSTMVGVACITVFHEIVTEAKSRFRNGFLLLILLFYMFMLQGRMNVLALIIVMALAFLIYVVQYKNWKWLFLPVLPIILVAVLFPILPESVSSRYLQLPDLNYDISGEESDFNSATYRFAEWKGAGEVIAEHFFFGTGVGDNRDALINAYEEIGFHVGVDHRYNAHNQYIETFIASGLVGFLLLLSFMGYWLYKLFQAKDLSALLGLLFFMLCMLTESMLERAWAVIFLAVYFSVMVLSNRPDLEVKNRL